LQTVDPSLSWLIMAIIVSALLLVHFPHQTAKESPCAISRQGDDLLFKVGNQLVANYTIDPHEPKPHFHPLYSLDGQPMTRFFPMVKDVPGETRDHPHHRGCWIGHQIVLLDSKEEGKPPLNVNFWAELVNPTKQVQGKQVCVKVEEPKSAPEHAWIVTHNEWVTTSGKKILDEKRTLHLIDLPPLWHGLQSKPQPASAARLIIFDIDFHASVGAITFGDEKDGFMAIRVADVLAEKSKKGGLLENAEGKQHMGANDNKDRQGCWGLHSAWVDYSGPLNGKTVGVALLDHPKNPVPACWHARDYGLLTANPFGRKDSKFPDAKESADLVKIPAGEHLKFRYGVLIHDGHAKTGKVAEHYQIFKNTW
jgi:hypothetical protein